MTERIYYAFQIGEYYLGIKWNKTHYNKSYIPMLSLLPDVQSALLYSDLNIAMSIKDATTTEQVLKDLLHHCCNYALHAEEEEQEIKNDLSEGVSYSAFLETFKEKAKLVQINQFTVVIRNR